MKKLIIGLTVILILVLATYLIPNEESPEISGNIVEYGEVDKEILITGVNFRFLIDGEENPDIIVNEGDVVRIEFNSEDGFHDWVVDEFGVSSEKVNTEESTFVEFVASEKGTFEYYCSVGQHRANGMKGNLIVQ